MIDRDHLLPRDAQRCSGEHCTWTTHCRYQSRYLELPRWNWQQKTWLRPRGKGDGGESKLLRGIFQKSFWKNNLAAAAHERLCHKGHPTSAIFLNTVKNFFHFKQIIRRRFRATVLSPKGVGSGNGVHKIRGATAAGSIKFIGTDLQQ